MVKYIFFQNGIYDMAAHKFKEGFNTDIVSLVNVPRPYGEATEEEKARVRQRFLGGFDDEVV